jgi:hypothetical protein
VTAMDLSARGTRSATSGRRIGSPRRAPARSVLAAATQREANAGRFRASGTFSVSAERETAVGRPRRRVPSRLSGATGMECSLPALEGPAVGNSQLKMPSKIAAIGTLGSWPGESGPVGESALITH